MNILTLNTAKNCPLLFINHRYVLRKASSLALVIFELNFLYMFCCSVTLTYDTKLVSKTNFKKLLEVYL